MKDLCSSFVKCGSLLLLFVSLNGCNFGSQPTIHKRHIVEIKQMHFVPASLVVQRGDTVVWINHDFVMHDVTEEKHKSWRSSPLAVGASWQHVVEASAAYYCSIHQVMKGKLTVE